MTIRFTFSFSVERLVILRSIDFIMRLTLIDRKFSSPLSWSATSETVKGYILLVITIKWFDFYFTVGVANKRFSDRNPIEAFLRALESESVGMGKYNEIKDNLRNSKLWQKL